MLETLDRQQAWKWMEEEGRKLAIKNERIRTAAIQSGYHTKEMATAIKEELNCSGHSLAVTDRKKGGGFEIVGFIDFAGKGVRVTLYRNATLTGQEMEIRYTWAEFAKAAMVGIKEITEAEAFESGKAKARSGAGKQQKGQEEQTMTMLAKETETRALTLADYEARIHLYKEQIGTGYIGIGRTLIEAKEAKVVPHGQWESWVTETTGLTPRQAQRCMQAATEIREGSAMARLEMSKALMLLGSGLDEEAREEIAARAADEGATVKQLKEELRKAKLQVVQETGAAAEIREALKKAEEDRDQMERQMRAAEQGYKERIESAREDAYRRGEMARNTEDAAELRQMKKELEHANRLAADQRSAAMSMMEERDSLKLQIHEEREKAYVAGMQAGKPTDYDALKRNQADLLAAAEEAEKRASDAEAELEALRAGGAGQPDPAWKVLKVAVTRFMTDCEMLPLDPAALIPEKARIMANIERLEKWTDMMRIAMTGAVPGEGAVE